MVVCAACGTENPEGFRLCGMCGAALVEAVSVRRERRVVSVVFADLVGFTSRSERLDVEDVQAFLGGYHELLRRELESHGGLVEKFIGDAVMAVFGAPVAHEDDAERAVRAALAIQDAMLVVRERDGVDLHVRVGVTSGEALVALGVDPSSGEGVATGDVVNTAARLQSAAPVDGVLVDEWTYRLTDRAVRYAAGEPVVAKGKAEPVAVWQAVETRSLRPEQARVDGLPLVGREPEAAQLVAVLERARGDPSTQLVSMIGEPGIGKTRLVEELGGYVDGLPMLVTWRRGRSLSYGEGIAFWALGEMVKAQAGILESDPANVAGEKLGEAVTALVVDERDREWIWRHLGPLVGLEQHAGASSEGGQVEAFAAWRRFFEALAEAGPAVLVFEDIHWADDQLLDFIDLLADRAGAVPLLIVCTARPELLERRAHWAGGKTNAATISLRPLSPDDTARLVGDLLDQAVLPPEVQRGILDRAEGNPLYAQEYIRMLQDRGSLTLSDAGWTLTDTIDDLPESIQGIIAARLDTLTPDERSLVQDAAVIGKTAWISATCALSDRSAWQAEELVHALERKQLVRRSRHSSISGETEFAFNHALTRDVAYNQIPRAERASKHEAAAAWIANLAGERDDKAELLADHYRAALSLRRTLGEDTTPLTTNALAAFTEAAHQAANLHAHPAAARHYQSALELSPQDDIHLRAELLLGEAVALNALQAADEVLLQAALDAQVAAGHWQGASRTERMLADRYRLHGGNREEVDAHLDRAAEYAERIPPGNEMFRVASARAYRLATTGEPEQALALATRMIAIADNAGLSASTAMLRTWRGSARLDLGDIHGIDDMRAGAEAIAEQADALAPTAYANLADAVRGLGDLQAANAAYANAAEWASRFAHQAEIDWIRAERALQAYLAADWATARELLDQITADKVGMWSTNGRITLARGHIAEALLNAESLLDYAAASHNDEVLYYGLQLKARCFAADRDPTAALTECDRFLTRWHQTGGPLGRAIELSELTPTLARAGHHRKIRDAAFLLPEACRWRDALLLIADQQYGEAATLYEQIGSQPFAADAHLLAAHHANDDGRSSDAEHHATAVLAFVKHTGATLYQQRAEQYLHPSD